MTLIIKKKIPVVFGVLTAITLETTLQCIFPKLSIQEYCTCLLMQIIEIEHKDDMKYISQITEH